MSFTQTIVSVVMLVIVTIIVSIIIIGTATAIRDGAERRRARTAARTATRRAAQARFYAEMNAMVQAGPPTPTGIRHHYGPPPRVVAYKYPGTGPDVVLLHALGAGAVEWDAVARRLEAKGCRAVAVDMRGHGDSDEAVWSFPAVLADIGRVVSAMSLRSPAVVGHGLGGIVAAMWAREHPECPVAVVIDPQVRPAGLELSPFLRDVLARADAVDVVATIAGTACPMLVVSADIEPAELNAELEAIGSPLVSLRPLDITYAAAEPLPKGFADLIHTALTAGPRRGTP